MSEPVGFCTLCSTSIESFEGLTECPRCGTKGIPCDFKNQVDVTVNIHELRILCMWAENWANQIQNEAPEVVYGIVHRLRQQLPEDAQLTMLDELTGLRKEGIDFETNHPAGDRAKLTGDPE